MSEADPKVQAETAVEAAPEAERKKRPWKLILMLSVPLILLAIGGYLWLTSGRYVSTDNAYVQQDMVSVAPEVNGVIQEVLVHENQRVRRGQLLFRIDPRPFRIALAQAEAQIAREQALLNLSRTEVRAPADGVVSQTDRLQVGAAVVIGVPVVTLVRSATTYVEANYKETDLANMYVGQPAEIEVDAYPGLDVRGRVASIGAGTGSQFSVLPAQNASGNWVKVRQRVPVRIAIDRDPGRPMIAGLSTSVTVDTGERPRQQQASRR